MQLTKLLLDPQRGQQYYDYLTTVSFFDKATDSIVPVNTVKYGNSTFKRRIYFGNNYFDTTGTHFPDSVRLWQIVGLGAIPDFTFMPTNPMPSYTDFNLVTNTVTINSGITIPYSGITNATNVTIVISDGVNEVLQSIAINSNATNRLSNGATLNGNSVTIPASDLNVLSPSNNAFINIIV